MTNSNIRVLEELLILVEEGAEPASDRIVRNDGRVRRTIVFVPEPAAAIRVATEFAAEGGELIELDGGFGPSGAAAVVEAVQGRVPVGFVAYGIESLEGATAFKARYAAQRP